MNLVWLVSRKPSSDTKENLVEEQQGHIQRVVQKAGVPGNELKTSDLEAQQSIWKMALSLHCYKKGEVFCPAKPQEFPYRSAMTDVQHHTLEFRTYPTL